MKKILASLAIVGTLSACSDADVASRNLSKAADQFEVTRRIVFYNGITGEYILKIQGLCSLGNEDKSREISVTCKTDPVDASPYQYRVVFKPTSVVPDVEIRK